jgi:hypothetical protein
VSGARRALVAVGACCVVPAYAQPDEVTVYSARADSVSVTVYPYNLALITETRTVTLPDSAVTLVIQDVVDTLLPQSAVVAVVAGLDRPLAESNFDFNQLTRESLLENAVGTSITLQRTNPATGVVSYATATVLAAGEEVVLALEDGNEVLRCSGLPEGIVFDAIPDGLYNEPQLSMKFAVGAGGERTFRVSYLAHGFTWSADYVARLDGSGERMDLAGWATVTNSSGRSFSQAELQLVAGNPNVLPANQGGSRADPEREQVERLAEQRLLALNNPAAPAPAASALRVECFASPVPIQVTEGNRRTLSLTGGASATYGADAMAGVVNVILAARESFGDYHLYRLPWRTDLGARQTKQVLFIDQRDAAIERIYRLDVSDVEGNTRYRRNLLGQFRRNSDADLLVPRLLLRTSNVAASGLGEPLPAGFARIFESSEAGEIFIGEALVQNVPTGAEIEFALGRALDVLVEYRRRLEDGARPRIEADVLTFNDKDVPIAFEVRHRIDTDDYVDIAIERSTRPFETIGGTSVWRFEIPPGDAALRYVLSAREIDD